MSTTDFKQDEEKTKCYQVSCANDATMTIDLLVQLDKDVSYTDSVPYCDADLGWFYRSLSRPSYDTTTVLGITILIDCDAEFARMQKGE